MLKFQQYVTVLLEQQATDKQSQGVNAQWDQLLQQHRIQFTNKFKRQSLTIDDKQFIVNVFDHYKYCKQLKSGHVFRIKLKGNIFQLCYLGRNQQWAASLQTSKYRQVTRPFQVTEMKIASLIQLFDKAINQQTFKDILPVTTRN